MKEVKDIVQNTFTLLRTGKNSILFLTSLFLFGGLLSFFYGLFTIPVPGGVLGFYRMEEPTAFEYGYLVFSAVVSALIVTLTVHATRIKIDERVKGKGASALGLTTGIFGAVCPACLGINFLAFGNVFTTQLAFLIPYIFWIQLGGIVLLSVGLYLVAKSAYTKECLVCTVQTGPQNATPTEGERTTTNMSAMSASISPSSGFQKLLPAVLLFVLFIFVYQVGNMYAQNTGNARGETSGNILTTEDGRKIDIEEVIQKVTPDEGFQTQVRWGDVVPKMIETGVLDPQKLETILKNRYGQEMKPEWRAVLAGEDIPLSIDNDNAVFMMYMLWAMAKHNQNQILADSPIAKYFENYDIGVGRAGYNDTPLLALNPEQQALAKRVAENAYRPCCGNSTAVPDCSHGYSALGLVQLMASQGFSEEEIFDTFVKFNSYWFPETYIKNALYFEITEGLSWEDVDKKLVAGKEYSTLRGSYKAKNFLKQNFGI